MLTALNVLIALGLWAVILSAIALGTYGLISIVRCRS